MHTDHAELLIGKADGTVDRVLMRYNGSHQRGYRCFIGPLALSPERIRETTPPSFEGRRLFDALAEYRKSIEPEGWRLLHAAARRDCWGKPDELGPYVERLREGIEQTEKMNAFDPAAFDEVATLVEQQASFEEWMRSLAPVFAPRAPRKSGHEHDEPVVAFSALSMLAGEYLASDEPDYRRALRKSLAAARSKRRPFPY
jgi:hypothetical protein